MTTGSQMIPPDVVESLLDDVLETLPDAMLAVDRAGLIVFANHQAERLFGYPREALTGHPVELLIPAGARDAHRAHRTRYVEDPRPRAMGAGLELAGVRRDGSHFPAEIALASVERDGRLLVLAAIRDVSERLEAQAERERLKAQAERERLERRIHQSERLESLGQLAGGVAHDFNNLLGVILNYAAFVAVEVAVAGDRWEAVRNDVGEIQRAAERATALTRQLLAFGRREVVQPVLLNVNDIVLDVERLLRRALGEHVELIIAPAPELWSVEADGGQLEQVLVNLAVNARDSMPGGGKLVIETQNVTVDDGYVFRRPALEPGRHVRLRVSDTGTGMPPDVVERAFEPFFTTKAKGEGTGLGLATVYGIVKQAGGDIEIYSEAGLGTTISVVLPAADAPQDALTTPIEPRLQRGGETVLVVEDEDAMREVTRRILTRNGYRVIVAENGADAIAKVQAFEASIDLLLTDVVMPQMLGKEVAERIDELRPGIKVLYMSGYAQPIFASQGTLEPGVSLIEKPFSEALLLAKMRKVLDTPRASTPVG